MSKRTLIATAVVLGLMIGGAIAAVAAGYPPALRSAHSEPAKQAPPLQVAVTDEGKLYHKPDCTFIHGSVRMVPGAQAVAEGYTACTRCFNQHPHPE